MQWRHVEIGGVQVCKRNVFLCINQDNYEMSITALVFLLMFALGNVLAFVKHPIFGVFSYMLVLYMAPGDAWWAEDVPNLRWSLLAAIVPMIAIVRFPLPAPAGRPPWYKTEPARWLITFSLWLWIQTPWALNPDDHIFMASLFTKYVILYAVLYSCMTSPANARQFFFAHIIGCFLWGYVAYTNPGTGRLENIGTGDIAGSAFASMQLGTGLAFAGFAFLGNKGLRKWAALATIPFVLNAIVLMATRGAFVGLLLGALAAAVFAPKSQRRLVLLAVSLAPVLLFLLANELFWSRMSTIPVGDDKVIEASADSRIDIARANLEMFLDHPFGVGHRGNEKLSPNYLPPNLMTNKDGVAVRAAHNTIMAVLVDHGIIGIVLFGFFHISIARALMRIRFRSLSEFAREYGAYSAALGTSLVIYWGNSQFANCTKAEVIVWIAVLACSLEWMVKSSIHSEQTLPASIKH